ncbi:unnamed protein product [Alternaria alternata]
MSSVFSPLEPTEAVLQALQDELKGNMFRNIDGFFAKYFEGRPWSAAVQNRLQELKLAKKMGKLSGRASDIAHPDALAEWLVEFETLFFAGDQASLHFQSQPCSNVGNMSRTAVYLETSGVQSIAGNTRVFGEFHLGSAPTEAGGDDILRFCERARQVFIAQSARCFVHGFLVRGTALELWVFDRSGAYSSDRLDLTQSLDLLVQTLASYTLMTEEEVGFNTFIRDLAPGSDSYVAFHQDHKFYLRPELVATANYMVGPGTTCYVASTSPTEKPDTVIKFSWREEEDPREVSLLLRAHERKAWGVIKMIGYRDLVTIADLRLGLRFSQPFTNRRFSCVASEPLGRPIRQFASISELLEVLCDLVRALQSLYVDARILHRDVAIKNLIITPQHSDDSPKGVLLDFNAALDLDNVLPVEPMVGSDGFMAIGILSGRRHTYRHDLESLFYVFLWIAIANDSVHDEAEDILKSMPETSRLQKWVSMDFGGVGRHKAADMSPEGFEGILEEFSSDFVPLQGLARELHALMFPVREGKIFTGTDTDHVAVQKLYNDIADAFTRSVRKL